MHPVAAELVNKIAEGKIPDLTEDHVNFLADLIKHNDSAVGATKRVGSKTVRAKLAELGVKVSGMMFDRLIKHHFGRTWSGK